MRKATLLLATIVANLLLSACGGSSPAPGPSPTFTALPHAFTDRWGSYAIAMSPDGNTIGGGSWVNGLEIGPVTWHGGTILVLPFTGPEIPGMARTAQVTAVSDAGVLAGNQGYGDMNPLASYWADGAWHEIVNPADGVQAMDAGGISSDGNVIVGIISGNGAPAESPSSGGFYLDRSTGGFAVIPSSFLLDRTCASDVECRTIFRGVTGDGLRAVGSDTFSVEGVTLTLPIVYRIRGSSAPLRLPLPYNLPHGEVAGASADGTTFVGAAFGVDMPTMAVYWDEGYRVNVLGNLGPGRPISLGGPPSEALAASAGGDRIVGSSNGQAFLFEQGGQMESLQDWLLARGLGPQLDGWTLMAATAISADGHWVVGAASDRGGYLTAFQVYLP